jgi:hypothetical protein
VVNAQQQPVKVKVWQENLQDGKIRYYYRVINNTEHSIVSLSIGFDYYHGVPELSELPVGWNFNNGLPPSSVTSPSGWTPLVTTQEESNFIFINWDTPENDNRWDIKPGQMLSGFSILLPREDNRYRVGHFDVILSNSTDVSALLEADDTPPNLPDTTPPNISVTLTPNIIWPPNPKMVKVLASISVQDNRDPNPIVRLVNITCNEVIVPSQDIIAALRTDARTFFVRAERTGKRKDGRVYTVTYSATDASGNTSIATATITIPHDQRNQ